MHRENRKSQVIATMECPKKTWHSSLSIQSSSGGQVLSYSIALGFHNTVDQTGFKKSYPTIKQAHFTSTHFVLSPGTCLICFEFWRASCAGLGGALHWRPALINLWGRRGGLTGKKSLNRRVINDALYRTVRKSANNKVLYPSKQPEARILTTVLMGMLISWLNHYIMYKRFRISHWIS